MLHLFRELAEDAIKCHTDSVQKQYKFCSMLLSMQNARSCWYLWHQRTQLTLISGSYTFYGASVGPKREEIVNYRLIGSVIFCRTAIRTLRRIYSKPKQYESIPFYRYKG